MIQQPQICGMLQEPNGFPIACAFHQRLEAHSFRMVLCASLMHIWRRWELQQADLSEAMCVSPEFRSTWDFFKHGVHGFNPHFLFHPHHCLLNDFGEDKSINPSTMRKESNGKPGKVNCVWVSAWIIARERHAETHTHTHTFNDGDHWALQGSLLSVFFFSDGCQSYWNK